MGANDPIGIIEDLGQYLPQMTEWRRHIHANPETAFEEVGTAAYVAQRLRSFGVDEVHEGIARTGVVGVIRGRGTGTRAIGLRADMDALDMQEGTGLPWASRNAGKHHACGHDGHTAMLLGAARHLAATRWLRAGVPLKTAAKWGGWKDTTTMLRWYEARLPGDDELAAARMSA